MLSIIIAAAAGLLVGGSAIGVLKPSKQDDEEIKQVAIDMLERSRKSGNVYSLTELDSEEDREYQKVLQNTETIGNTTYTYQIIDESEVPEDIIRANRLYRQPARKNPSFLDMISERIWNSFDYFSKVKAKSVDGVKLFLKDIGGSFLLFARHYLHDRNNHQYSKVTTIYEEEIPEAQVPLEFARCSNQKSGDVTSMLAPLLI